MFKKLLTAVLVFFAAAAFAAVDVNKANQAELETVTGIGPGIAGKMLEERKKGPFKDWADLVDRVSGVGEGNAQKFSSGGLTVNGKAFSAAAPAGNKKAESKPADEKKAKASAKEEKKAQASGKPASAAEAKGNPKK